VGRICFETSFVLQDDDDIVEAFINKAS